jgi:hypothetical protein
MSLAPLSGPGAAPADPGFTAPPRNSPEVAWVPEDMVRLDVVRRTETRTSTGPDGTTRTEIVPVPLSEYGVALGNGLFYDLNGNLSLVPLLAFYAPVAGAALAGFSVDPPGPLNTTRVSRQGDRTTIDPPGPFDQTVVQTRPDGVDIDSLGLGNTTRIRQNGNATVIDPDGRFNSIILERVGGEVRVRNDAHPPTVLRTTDRGLELAFPGFGFPKTVTVEHRGNRIEIDPPGLFNTTTITVEPERIEVDRPGFWNGTTITRQGNRVIVDPPGFFNEVVVTRGPGA